MYLRFVYPPLHGNLLVAHLPGVAIQHQDFDLAVAGKQFSDLVQQILDLGRADTRGRVADWYPPVACTGYVRSQMEK